MAHQEFWGAEVEAADGICLHKFTGLYDRRSMYSHERDLGVELWCVAADLPEDADASAKSVFSSSVLLKTKAVPGLLPCFPRSSMLNFAKDLAFANAGDAHDDGDLERFLVCKLVGLS